MKKYLYHDTDTQSTRAGEDLDELLFTKRDKMAGISHRSRTELLYDSATRTLTLRAAPGYTEFVVWSVNTEFIITAPLSIILPVTDNQIMVCIDDTGSLITSTNVEYNSFESNHYAIIAYCSVIVSSGIVSSVQDMRFDVAMPPATRNALVMMFGTKYKSGLKLTNFSVDGSGDLDKHAQFQIEQGAVWMVDFATEIPVYSFPANLLVVYKIGSEWKVKPADNFPMVYEGSVGSDYTGSLVPYNHIDPLTGEGSLLEPLNNNFLCIHIFVGQGANEGIFAVQGQFTYTNRTKARHGAVDEITRIVLSSFMTKFFTPIGSVIIQTGAGRSNTPHAEIVSTDTGKDYLDFRLFNSMIGSGSSGYVEAPVDGNFYGRVDGAWAIGYTKDQIDAEVNKINYREPMDTGVHTGGEITKGTGNLDVDIAAGDGVTIDAITDPLNVSHIDVTWDAMTLTVTPTATDTQEIHNIYIDSNGIPFSVPIQNDGTSVLSNIRLGWIQIDLGVIFAVIYAPHVIGQTSVGLMTMFRRMNQASISTGLRVKPATGLNTFVEEGTLILPGIAWSTNPEDQHSYDVPQAGDENNPVTFSFFNQLGKPVIAAQTNFIKNYDNAGTLTPLTGGEAVIHYIFFSAGGYAVQIGTTAYVDFADAFRNASNDLDTFQFAPGANMYGRSILLAQVVISNLANDFSDKSLADIISIINSETGNTVSPIDLNLVPQYLLNTVAAEDLSMGDELSMDINGHLQKYPATGGEGTSEYTTDNVDIHAAVFLNTSTNQGVIVWRNSTTTNVLNYRTAQGNADGSISYSTIATLTVGSNVNSIRLCKIDSSRAGLIWGDSNGANLGILQNNGLGSAPTIGTRRVLTSSAVTDVAVCWAGNEGHLIGVYCQSGTVYNRYCTISGNSVESPPYDAISMVSGTQCRCVSEGGNVIVTAVNGTVSNWREAAWDKPLWSTGRYDDQTDTETVSNCPNHCGMQAQAGTILAQFENSGNLQTYKATYSSGSSMGTPSIYGAAIAGKWGDLVKTDSGIGYTVILRTDGQFEIYEGTITGTYQQVYSSTLNVGTTPTEVQAIMFSSVFGIGIKGDYTWANDVILIDSSVTRTDHFVAVAPSNILAGQRFSADIALPLITLPREYAPGTTYEYGPYKYQVITHNQAAIIIEATTMM
jgi:hypothetical protein